MAEQLSMGQINFGPTFSEIMFEEIKRDKEKKSRMKNGYNFYNIAKDTYLLEVSVPGLAAKDLEVNIKGPNLYISLITNQSPSHKALVANIPEFSNMKFRLKDCEIKDVYVGQGILQVTLFKHDLTKYDPDLIVLF